MNTKSTLSAIGAAILGVCGFIAGMPAQLESQIPQLFPENQRGWIAIFFGLAAYGAHHYSAASRDPLTVASAPLPLAPLVPAPMVQTK